MLPTADEKPSASLKEACYKARLLFIRCSSRIVVSIRSAPRLVLWNYFLKHFAFQLEQKRDLFSSGGKKKNKNRQKEKKRREVKDLQVPSLFIKKKKINSKNCKKNPLLLLSNVKTKQKGSQDLRWKTWKNKQSKKPLLSIFKSFFLAWEYILWKPGKTGTCTIYHVRLSKHT